MAGFGHFQFALADGGTAELVGRGWWRSQIVKGEDGLWRYDAHGSHVTCGHRGCNKPATHMSGYSYVTGRRGNVSVRESFHCPDHAASFAERHLSTLPTEDGQ